MPKKASAPTPADLTYQQASAELETIIRSLESNQLELEESLDQYQRGVELLAELRTRLATAEQRVEALMGEIEPEDDETRDTTLS
ncbi:MAG: exodeoxyribonuclease VII small subunit [Coriobacteriia bacterium]|nr:exodeoxyribonuclease VII small subunit [Coriobacteriia bacterium]MBS5477097.1 exodeoxyribonuclease VII small subunit [Coriobacteriia bacterium]